MKVNRRQYFTKFCHFPFYFITYKVMPVEFEEKKSLSGRKSLCGICFDKG